MLGEADNPNGEFLTAKLPNHFAPGILLYKYHWHNESTPYVHA